LLGDLIHLVHGDIDLGQAGGLFPGRGGDLAHQFVDGFHLPQDLAQGLASLADQANPLLHLPGGALDQGLDLLGRLG